MSMKVDTSVVIRNVDGLVSLNEKGNPLTVGMCMVESLLAAYPDEQMLSGDEKLKRWQIATHIQKHNIECALSVEDMALVKTLVGKGYGPLVVGQVWTVIESAKGGE